MNEPFGFLSIYRKVKSHHAYILLMNEKIMIKYDRP